MLTSVQLSLFDLVPATADGDVDDGLVPGGSLVAWAAARRHGLNHQPGLPADVATGGVRFAFYGRVSTAELQDPASSRQWQRDSAVDLIGTESSIVAEFFDVGCSRRLQWSQRPQARLLLKALTEPEREFDAIVVGEFDRAFTGTQLLALAPRLAATGVAVWLPEVGGQLDLSDDAHRAVVLAEGARSRREVVRARFRTTAAMTVQAREQGRYLGGRPPYGYRLVDAGPHPNRAHAAWGRRLHRLDPDPVTAPQVQWIFAQRKAGSAVAGIARALNEAGVPCPSKVDAGRNGHRSGLAWTAPTVAAILANPRYTGHQVWNRQPTVPPARESDAGATAMNGEAGGPEDRSGPERTRPQRWNPAGEWVISSRPAHPALVSEGDFLAVQDLRAARRTADGSRRTYLLTGIVRCGACGRRMDSHWANNRPGYRCRHGRTSAHTRESQHGNTVYVREDELLADLRHLTREHLPEVRDDARRTAQYLRSKGIVIVCDGLARRLERADGNPAVLE
jgi:site-specific DNA recombinase